MPAAVLESYLDANRARILGSLVEWLRIPSISARREHLADVEASAAWCAEALRVAGMQNVQLLRVDHGNPAVYGDWRHAPPGSPTVLVYGHHDVQPVDPLEQWSSPPFEPVVTDTHCLARGATDDKGQVLYQIEAARGLLQTSGMLPVNLVFLIEGEEEVGSPTLERLLTQHSDLLAADAVVVSDTGMLGPRTPSTTIGMRGLVSFDVRLRTAPADLHSGIWGGTVPNAALLAAQIVSSMHDSSGRVTIPGFYDRVEEPSEAERSSLAAVPFDEQSFMATAGVAFLDGELARSPLERTRTRPTAEIVGLYGGYTGEGIKTIVPATAGFKVALRLVPDQRPAEVGRAFESWLRSRVPEGVELEIRAEGAVAPASTPPGHPGTRALCRVIERIWGLAPLLLREGGSGPEEALGRVLDAPVLFLGVSLPEDRLHAPDERVSLDQLWKGLLAAGELLVELGGIPSDVFDSWRSNRRGGDEEPRS